MKIREEESKLFSELKLINQDLIEDGIVNEDEYISSKFKIIYVLKEVNGGKDWNLREFLQEGGRGQTWKI